jgi:hypothetical protein|tara:strand:- start:50 stop:229 length:180 start_codon:yes stop_codon:yes gene_type:complete
VLLAVHLDLVVELRELGGRDLVQGHIEGAEEVGTSDVEVVDTHRDARLVLEDGLVDGAL